MNAVQLTFTKMAEIKRIKFTFCKCNMAINPILNCIGAVIKA